MPLTAKKRPLGGKNEPAKKKRRSKELQQYDSIGYSNDRFHSCVRYIPERNEDFKKLLVKEVGSFLNDSGGKLCFGCRPNGTIFGESIIRKEEDNLKLEIDYSMKRFHPFVDPAKYRVDFRRVRNSLMDDLVVIEISVSFCGGEMYEDEFHEVHLRKNGRPYGPLTPHEIKAHVTAQYKKTMAALASAALSQHSLVSTKPPHSLGHSSSVSHSSAVIGDKSIGNVSSGTGKNLCSFSSEVGIKHLGSSGDRSKNPGSPSSNTKDISSMGGKNLGSASSNTSDKNSGSITSSVEDQESASTSSSVMGDKNSVSVCSGTEDKHSVSTSSTTEDKKFSSTSICLPSSSQATVSAIPSTTTTTSTSSSVPSATSTTSTSSSVPPATSTTSTSSSVPSATCTTSTWSSVPFATTTTSTLSSSVHTTSTGTSRMIKLVRPMPKCVRVVRPLSSSFNANQQLPIDQKKGYEYTPRKICQPFLNYSHPQPRQSNQYPSSHYHPPLPNYSSLQENDPIFPIPTNPFPLPLPPAVNHLVPSILTNPPRTLPCQRPSPPYYSYHHHF